MAEILEYFDEKPLGILAWIDRNLAEHPQLICPWFSYNKRVNSRGVMLRNEAINNHKARSLLSDLTFINPSSLYYIVLYLVTQRRTFKIKKLFLSKRQAERVTNSYFQGVRIQAFCRPILYESNVLIFTISFLQPFFFRHFCGQQMRKGKVRITRGIGYHQ